VSGARSMANGPAGDEQASGQLLAIKALTVRQPWAWATIYGGKDVENRRWRTTYRGPAADSCRQERRPRPASSARVTSRCPIIAPGAHTTGVPSASASSTIRTMPCMGRALPRTARRGRTRLEPGSVSSAINVLGLRPAQPIAAKNCRRTEHIRGRQGRAGGSGALPAAGEGSIRPAGQAGRNAVPGPVPGIVPGQALARWRGTRCPAADGRILAAPTPPPAQRGTGPPTCWFPQEAPGVRRPSCSRRRAGFRRAAPSRPGRCVCDARAAPRGCAPR
jgi:hypothetical protein